MEINKYLSNRELEKMSTEERLLYFNRLKEYCTNLTDKNSSISLGQQLISKIYPTLRNYDIDIIGENNIPKNNSSVFICNHSNSHDIFSAYEVFSELDKSVSVLVATDCLSPFSKSIFSLADSTFIDRRDKKSSSDGVFELSNKILNGKNGFIFGEATWNIHPYIPMHNIKLGGAKVGMITKKEIVPTIFQYVEVPEICSKENELYTKCIVAFGKPITVGVEDNLVEKTTEVQELLKNMRQEIWKKIGYKANSLEDVNIEVYLNHTYLKKYGAFGFTYDSEKEVQFLFSKDGKPIENEYFLDNNGNFVPGVTKKKTYIKFPSSLNKYNK